MVPSKTCRTLFKSPCSIYLSFLLVFLYGGRTLKKHAGVIQTAYEIAPPGPSRSTPVFRSTVADLNKYN